MRVDELIYERLRALGIAYDRTEHPPAHTIGDCAWAGAQLSALVPKNLFLAPRNLSAFYLCIVHPDTVFRTADISKQIGSSRLSFGPEDRLPLLLRTFPGAVSPMGLMFPEAAGVRLLIDTALLDIPRLAFHPNDNRQTLAMSKNDFFGIYLPATGHTLTFVHG